MFYHYGIKVTYRKNSNLEYTIPIRIAKKSPKEAIATAIHEELFLRERDYELVTSVNKLTKEEHDHLLAPGSRKVLLTDGMSPSKVLVITDVPEMKIVKWCRQSAQELLPNDDFFLDSLQEEGYFVRVLVDTEEGPGYLEDIDVIGYDEVYDLCDFYDLE